MRLSGDMQARIFALVFLSCVEISAQYLLPFMPRNDLYFVACGAFNLITLLVLTVTYRAPFMLALAKLTYLQLFLQFVGWCLYSLYMPAHLYNWSIHIIVIVTFARIFWIGSEDGNSANYPYWRLVSGNVIRWPGHTCEVHQ